jgi:ceramide glucosyltransferase
MVVKLLLIAWSCAGLLWSALSWGLVVANSHPSTSIPKTRKKKFLSIFKPLPLLNGRGLAVEERGMESFIAQLDETSELLLGVHEADWPEVSPFVNRMKLSHPNASIVVVRKSGPDMVANPKIAWQKILALQAKGDVWLWSDADIIAPPGFVNLARDEYEACRAGMLTFPYVIRSLPHMPTVLDALFVNVEFYPGVLLLRRLGPVDFGLGASMIFSRDVFLNKTNWAELGASLADDFVLGQTLKPVQLSATTLETVADARTWPSAWDHYFRWKKTICWCRPWGFAGQLIAMPVMGWLACVFLHPIDAWAWAGLFGMIQSEVLFAILICRQVGCMVNYRFLLAIEAWSLLRILFWLLCWLPGPVSWREKIWHHSRQPA